MVISCYSLTTSLSRARDLLDVLRSVSGPSLFMKGCITSDIWQNPDNPGMFMLHEEWNSLADLESHISSPLYHRLLAAMELCIIKPQVIFMDGQDIRGIEWVEQLRTIIAEREPK
ncbi:MAG TPA: antibiotic biosynthesis monooxygenase [Bacteroidales bacterium]|nr:antibiotic biosynthesis monooxygenase [Bacteroidales bacterium]HRZ21067.1 antibiotic biosynthesis monooxygenase [Bacteroidales bacterium]